MKYKSKIWKGVMAGVLVGLIASPVSAVEIITREDIVNNVIKKEQLVKVADNAVFMLDTSSSTKDIYKDTGKSILETMNTVLQERAAYFPEIGTNMAIYTYTKWQENMPMQVFNREVAVAALKTVRDEPGGPTALKMGLKKLEGILKPLTGRTAVFLFWDGEYTGENPADTARELAKNYDVCFYVISSANEKREAKLSEDVATLNACSRVIPLANFINRPDYTTGALFDVKVTEEVVTTTDTKIVGLKADDINFATNKSALSAEDKAELDKVATFMSSRPNSYAVIAGYTDNVGTRDHNEGLSRDRAKMVGGYLTEKGIGDSRLVLFWYGPNNPKVPNDTPENQAKNRRVELAVGLGQK